MTDGYAYRIPDRERWLKISGLVGSFTNEITGEDISFHEVDHYTADKSVGAPEYWEVQGDNGDTYFITETGDILDKVDNNVGHFDPYADPDPDRQEGLPDFDEYESKTAAATAQTPSGSIEGVVGVPGHASGIAIMPDKQTPEDIEKMISDLGGAGSIEDRTKYRNLMNQVPKEKRPYMEHGGGIDYSPTGRPFASAGFILVAQYANQTDQITALLLNPQCDGVVTETGGIGSHAVVMMQPMGKPVIVAAAGIVGMVEPGQKITLTAESESRNEENPEEPQVNPMAEKYRWVYVVPTGQEFADPVKSHFEIYAENDLDPSDCVVGYIYNNGKCDIILQGAAPNMTELQTWLRSLGAEEFNTIDMTKGAKVAENEEKKALTCPECGSHTLRAMGIDEHNDSAQMKCLSCGNEFKHKGLLKNPESASKFGPGTRVQITKPGYTGKGSILSESGSDKNFDEGFYDILLDNGEKMEKVPESAFKKIKSSSNEDLPDTTLTHFVETQDFEQPYEWTGYEFDEKKSYGGDFEDDSYDEDYHGLDFADPGGNSALRAQGPNNAQERGMDIDYYDPANDSGVDWSTTPPPAGFSAPRPIGSVADLQGNDLQAGHWYTMYSPKYKVPDVIQVLNADDHRIEAAIQGDNKGQFPIAITPEDIEKQGYTFEPYMEKTAADPYGEVPEWNAPGGPPFDDDLQENPPCPMCGGPGVPLGQLGSRMHFRCRNCGSDFSETDGQGPIDQEQHELDMRYLGEPTPDNTSGEPHYRAKGGWKLARRNFSPKEQSELIEESPNSLARNIEKLNLDDTHYVQIGSYDDPDFLWI